MPAHAQLDGGIVRAKAPAVKRLLGGRSRPSAALEFNVSDNAQSCVWWIRVPPVCRLSNLSLTKRAFAQRCRAFLQRSPVRFTVWLLRYLLRG